VSEHTHPAIASFETDNAGLLLGGVPLERLAARIGSTPFYAYDRSRIADRISYLRRHLPKQIHLSYAIKANPMPAVVQYMSGIVDGFDVASALEMKTALDTPMEAEKVSFAGPGKTTAELAQAIAAGIVIEIESEGEMRRIDDLANETGIRPRVAIRVNPDFSVKASAMRMGGGSAQFGIDAERIPAVLAEVKQLDMDLLGFHIFSGSQNLRADLLAECQEQTVALALQLADVSPIPIRHLNLGGGFGIPYFPNDEPLDLPFIGDKLHTLLAEQIEPRLPDARVIIELGRYIVGEAGIYVCRVVDRKESRGQVYLVTDGGLHHQLAASGNFGQVIRRNYPVAVGTKMNWDVEETVSIVGCLCTPLDLLADKVPLPTANVGDLIVIFQSGAYGYTASPTAFLSHPSPLEVLV